MLQIGLKSVQNEKKKKFELTNSLYLLGKPETKA